MRCLSMPSSSSVRSSRSSSRRLSAEASLSARAARSGISSSAKGVPQNSSITVAQLEERVERQAVVDAPDRAVAAQDAVPALPVGVVCDQVEGREPPKLLRVIRDQVEVGDPRVRLDVQLHGADAVGPLANRGQRDGRPSDRPAEHELRLLPLVQRAARKVEQWPLTGLRLVHRTHEQPRPRVEPHQERVVGAPGDLPPPRSPHPLEGPAEPRLPKAPPQPAPSALP